MALEAKGKQRLHEFLRDGVDVYKLTGCVWNGTSCESTDITPYMQPDTLDFSSLQPTNVYADPATAGKLSLVINLSTLASRQIVIDPPAGKQIMVSGILAYQSSYINEGAVFGGTFPSQQFFPEQGTFTLDQMDLELS